MRFSKPQLPIEKQADLLLNRGLEGDKNSIEEALKRIGYYRLSFYTFPFREAGGDHFKSGTTLEDVVLRYDFDRQLRIISMDALERIEIFTKRAITSLLTERGGPFAHLDTNCLPNFDPNRWDGFLRKVKRIQQPDKAGNYRDEFIRHYFSKYTTETDLPLWMALEILGFGETLSTFKGMPARLKKSLAHKFSIPLPIFTSWLLCMHSLRNICAHHNRLWDRRHGLTPSIPKSPEWHDPIPIGAEPNFNFALFTVAAYMVTVIEGDNRWVSSFVDLIDRNPGIPLHAMRFPPNWRTATFWSL